jgi:hypothetical protein
MRHWFAGTLARLASSGLCRSRWYHAAALLLFCLADSPLAVLLLLQVYVDLKQVESGSLYDDFDMLPPKTIKVRQQQRGLLAALVGITIVCAANNMLVGSTWLVVCSAISYLAWWRGVHAHSLVGNSGWK